MPSKEYIAPLRHVDDAEREVIPREYLVYLRLCHSTTAHPAAVGTRMEAYMLASPEIRSKDGNAYSCKGVSDSLLQRVRSNPGVEMVDCNFKPAGKSDAAANCSTTYQALLRTNDEHGDVVSWEYLVTETGLGDTNLGYALFTYSPEITAPSAV
jgi:hypothetical protein